MHSAYIALHLTGTRYNWLSTTQVFNKITAPKKKTPLIIIIITTALKLNLTHILNYYNNFFSIPQRHKMYAMRYFACEFLCLLNITVQMWLMNCFFDGEFFSYGWRVMNLSETPQEQRYDPMVYVFPRITKCLFHKYGASGSIQKHDALCVLPLNIVNEKTYIFIWFWYIILILLLLGLVIYR